MPEAIALIEPKLCINHWKVLCKLCVFYVDRNSMMTTTAGHSFYIGPIVFFYNQVQDWLHLAKLFQRRRFVLTLANQKKELILAAMFVGQME
jgi:ABC-type polysaccharide/polyol phosphate export permease